MFLAEEGVECLTQHKDDIRACIQEAVPELQSTIDDPDSLNMDNVVINEEQCGYVHVVCTAIIVQVILC